MRQFAKPVQRTSPNEPEDVNHVFVDDVASATDPSRRKRQFVGSAFRLPERNMSHSRAGIRDVHRGTIATPISAPTRPRPDRLPTR